MNILTVTVVEWHDGTFQQVVAFTDDEPGNREAEELFRAIAREQNAVEVVFSDEKIEDGITEGTLDHPLSDWQLHLMHSRKRPLLRSAVSRS